MGDALVVDAMPEEVKFLHTKNTLAWVYHYATGGEPFKDSAEVFKVLCRRSTGTQNIINVCANVRPLST